MNTTTPTITDSISEERFIDIHCHILFGLDDGAKNLDHAIHCLEDAAKIGLKKIICTPHRYDAIDRRPLEQMKSCYRELLPYTKKLGIELYPGNEIMLSEDTLSLLREKKVLPLNQTQYVLVELKRQEDRPVAEITELFEDLMDYGYIPVLAHPEFYRNYRKVSIMESWSACGVLLQIDAASMMKGKDKACYRFAQKLLKKKLISFAGSDTHGTHHRHYALYEQGYEEIVKRYGWEYAHQIFYTNPQKLLKGETI